MDTKDIPGFPRNWRDNMDRKNPIPDSNADKNSTTLDKTDNNPWNRFSHLFPLCLDTQLPKNMKHVYEK